MESESAGKERATSRKKGKKFRNWDQINEQQKQQTPQKAETTSRCDGHSL